jgi:pilus assembly protein CpaB
MDMAQRVAGAGQGRVNRRFLIVAFALAALSFILVYARISKTDGTSNAPAASGETPVVVARSVIKQRTAITAEMLEIRNVPGNNVTLGAFTTVADAVGKVTKFPIEANQQVVLSSVVDTNQPVANAALSQVVPTGRRGMAIPASEVNNAGGLVLPGDWVDVVWVCCKAGSPVASKTLLRNVQVAAVSQSIVTSGPVNGSTAVAGASAVTGAGDNPVAADQSKAAPTAASVTLLLTSDEAQQLFLAEQNGFLRLEERGFGDTAIPDGKTTLMTDILTPQEIAALTDALKPDGYKKGQ